MACEGLVKFIVKTQPQGEIFRLELFEDIQVEVGKYEKN